MPYDYLEELSVADEGFRVYHETLEGLFRDAWDAVLGLMVENPESIRARRERTLKIEQTEPELLFLKDAEDSFYRPAELAIAPAAKSSGESGSWLVLRGRLVGEGIDRRQHKTGVDVKAITLQGFSLERRNELWEATVVVDT
jgi:SHS2 domain-containing protein